MKTNLPKLNQALVNRHRVHFVLSLRAVLHEMAKSNRSAESLRAADEVERVITGSLGPSVELV